MRDKLISLLFDLRNILEREKECLRKRCWDRLPELTAEKLALVSEIRESLEKGQGKEHPVKDPEARRLVEEIRRLNEDNSLYIEEMLCFYQGILSMILPGQYNIRGINEPSPLCMSGLAIRREA